MAKKNLAELRLEFKPEIPGALDDLELLVGYALEETTCAPEIASLFPKTHSRPIVHFQKGYPPKHDPIKVGVVFSGGQASGGHNVISGLFDALQKINPESTLIGFKNGPQGIIDGKYIALTASLIDQYRNQGGFDLLGSGRTKIETEEQLESVDRIVRQLDLDGLVIIGGDDSNTNAGILSEFFESKGRKICVVGVPKTIDGDLRNEYIELPFGFDTAVKTYSNTIGDIARDGLSAKKYYFFVKLMGRSASHIALECAMQTHPNMTLIGEEIAKNKKTLSQIVGDISKLIIDRANKGLNYGVILIPEGLIEFIPEFQQLISELNKLLANGTENVQDSLTSSSKALLNAIPKEIQEQLMMERDSHGNVQVSKIETERLLIKMVEEQLEKSRTKSEYKGQFSAQPLFFGYEGRCSLPTNFDAEYCYALGHMATVLVDGRFNGYMATIKDLNKPVAEWEIAGVPLTAMFTMEMRKGKEVPVIKKCLVDLDGPLFKEFCKKRDAWELTDDYVYPGPIQFFGLPELTNSITFTLQMSLMHHLTTHHEG